MNLQSKKFQLYYRIGLALLLFSGLLSNIISNLNDPYHQNFIYYTFQSNFICFCMTMILIKNNLNDIRNGKYQGYQNKYIIVEYIVSIWIIITCLIYNFLLGDIFSSQYWSTYHNSVLHLFGPILYVLDFWLFSNGKLINRWHPLTCLIYPYLYIIYILVRSIILNKVYLNIPKGIKVFPYFFVDVSRLGYFGVFRWIILLTFIFLILSYLMYGLYSLKKYYN